MRKFHQQQILDAVKTLTAAAGDVKRLLAQRDMPSAIQLMRICVDSAAQIASIIEQLEGQGTETVFCLHEYCELLVQAGKTAGTSNVNQGLLKKLQKQLMKIESCVKNELKPNKIEIVFFPYKASMWDSMESIWMAAKDDPQCDAYVVPIPYYDKTVGGQLGAQHYEGGLYPDYVPVTHWQDYNIEDRCPDVIFFHNPYDKNNFVTEVHSNFFSERLKKFTDLLVYVPYFVTSVQEIGEGFCLQAGVLNADRVVVESENMRQSYIGILKTYDQAIANRGIALGSLTKKIAALGSPKFDKTTNSKPENFALPDEWDRLLKKNGGEKKKTVLYNVRLTDMTAGIENQLAKLEFVLESFKKLNDVVLWLRPHPLNETCLKSMRPYILDKYISIISEYKNAGWGIYDETPDLYRALCYSDAYYGDTSSLVALYQMTGKPVMLQDVELRSDCAGYKQLLFENLCEAEGFLWFTALDFNALFRLDPVTLQAEYMGSVPGEQADGYRLYRSLAYAGGKLYLAPLTAENIAIYDIELNTFQTLQINGNCAKAQRPDYMHLKFHDVIALDKQVYFIPFWYPAIAVYNVTTQELNYFDAWLGNTGLNDGHGYFCDAFHDSGDIIIPRFDEDSILVLNTNNMSFHVVAVNQSGKGYIAMQFDGVNYWMLSFNGEILKGDNSLSAFIPVGQARKFVSNEDNALITSAYLNGFLWVFPYKSKSVLRIDVNTMQVSTATSFPNIDIPSNAARFEDGRYILAKAISNKIYAHTGGHNPKFIEYDPDANYFREEVITVSEKDIPKIKALRRQVFNKAIDEDAVPNACNFPESFAGLNDLIDYLVQENGSDEYKAQAAKRAQIRRKAIVNSDGSAGRKIFEMAKKEVWNL